MILTNEVQHVTAKENNDSNTTTIKPDEAVAVTAVGFRNEILCFGYEILCFGYEMLCFGYEIYVLGTKLFFALETKFWRNANFVTNRKTENFVTVSKIKISLLPRKYKISSLLEKYKNPLFHTKNTQKQKISSSKIKKSFLKSKISILKNPKFGSKT